MPLQDFHKNKNPGYRAQFLPTGGIQSRGAGVEQGGEAALLYPGPRFCQGAQSYNAYPKPPPLNCVSALFLEAD
jgi:hypothetical protein